MSNAIYVLLRKIKGESLHSVLNMYITQFYYLINCISREIEQEQAHYKKLKSKRR